VPEAKPRDTKVPWHIISIISQFKINVVSARGKVDGFHQYIMYLLDVEKSMHTLQIL